MREKRERGGEAKIIWTTNKIFKKYSYSHKKYLNKTNLSPRFSLAYRLGNYDQINLNFVRKRGALFEYEIQVHASILDVFSEKAGAIAVGIAATIAVTNSAKIEKHFDYLENRLELQKKYSFVLKSGANSDFISTAISAASELSSSEEELKLKEKIILFTNQYFDYLSNYYYDYL